MLKQLKEDLGLKNVFFRGFVNPEEYYKQASIFCMTSAMEGLPMVIEEAAAFGCAPMAFAAFESIADLITDGENGRLIKPFDVDAYAKALKELIENEDFRMRLAKDAKRDVRRFDPDRIMNQWEELFEEAMSKRHKGQKLWQY